MHHLRFRKIFQSVMAVIILLLSVSCTLITGGQSQQLEDQISALETQNALLAAKIGGDSGESVTAPQPPANDPASTISLPKPTQESLPTGPVPAGTPVIYDGWALTLSEEIGTYNKYYGGHYFALSWSVKNLGVLARVFRFVRSGVTVFDDLGNYYEPSTCDDDPDDNYLPDQLTIEPGEKIVFWSRWGYDAFECNGQYIPALKGTIPVAAKQLIVKVNEWGPFNDVTFIIDL